jgi:5-amino-6-(5-phospho-D-ribitylamino)uracil phosphatase
VLIALDMDGTLLNSQGRVSERNKAAIVAAQKQGHIVAIVTGRAYKDARAPLRDAGLVCPIMSLNGAVMTLEDGTVLGDVPLDKEKLIPALEWVRAQPDLYCEIYTGDAVYVGLHNRAHLEAMAERASDIAPELKGIVEKQFQQARVTYVDDIRAIWEDRQAVFYKVLIFSLDQERLQEAASQFAGISGITVTSSHPNNIEINHEQATKGQALVKLVTHYGINLKDTVVFGDSHNDLSMFAVAGYRVAMGNAAPELKEVSDIVTASHEEDGVAVALEELIAKRKQ